MPWLVDSRAQQLALRTDGPTRIGRALDNDLVISDTTVSQHHAVISFDNGRAFVRDLGSSNGTFLEGRRIRGGRLTDGSVVKFGQVALAFRERAEAHSAAPLPYRSAASPAEATHARSLRNLISGRTAAVLGTVLAVLALIVIQLGRGHSPASGSSLGSTNLFASQDFRLPNATSAFLGDWCGWERLTSCEPVGSCDEEPMPTSLRFRTESGWLSSGGGVVLHYELLASADTEVRQIQVQAADSRHVEVSISMRELDSTGVEHIVNDHQELVSVDSTTVQETDHFADSVNGMVRRNEEKATQLQKCSDEFEQSEKEYIQRHNMVEKGEVSGKVP